MVKIKKKNLSDKVNSKRGITQKKLNPFEVHFNVEKINVLGRKQKNDRGLPGVSRAKAISKRKNTLLREYKQQGKTNTFMDKRIGEKNHQMSEEDRAMARFAAVKIKTHRKSKYNLADDEILTHKGQALVEIEKFDDPFSDDDDDNEEGVNKNGKLGADFVEDAHFGGGILTKTGPDGAKTHKDIIDQLIAESKKRKAEKQKIKEATLELTEQLDTEWKDLLPLVNKTDKNVHVKNEEKPKIDDYDKVMRELKFEARGGVSDRLKTEDEIAKDEKEKLEQLEKARLERMRGFVEEKVKVNHRSADDLDDDFVVEEIEENNFLTYNNDGEANVEIEAEINGKIVGESQEYKNDDNNKEEENEECEDSEDQESDEDDLSDLKADTSESEDEIANKPIENNEKKYTQNEEIKTDLLMRKEIMEKARSELPFTFSIPSTYEEFQSIMSKQSSTHQSVIIERMIKCNHPSLADGNKQKLGILFALLLQHLTDITEEATTSATMKMYFEIFTALASHLYELAQLNSESIYNSTKELLKEKYSEYKKNKKEYPGLEFLIFFKMNSLLFPTSDFRHQIITPSFIFMEQILNKCRVKNKRDVSYGLFLVTLVLEYTLLSKRFMPSAINYLSGILHMAIPYSGCKLIKVPPPFKPINNFLVLTEDCSQLNYDNEKDIKMDTTDLINQEIDNNFKIRSVFTTIKLIEEFHNQLLHLPSNVEIFEPIYKYLIQIQLDNYPKIVKNEFTKLKELLKSSKCERKLEHLIIEAQKPKALRLYEPRIEEVYDTKKFKLQSREKAERDKLLHKLKKAKKGALREIRKDNAFLSSVKIKEQIRSDQERKDKVKRIYAEASIQQSELNNLDRKRKKK